MQVKQSELIALPPSISPSWISVLVSSLLSLWSRLISIVATPTAYLRRSCRSSLVACLRIEVCLEIFTGSLLFDDGYSAQLISAYRFGDSFGKWRTEFYISLIWVFLFICASRKFWSFSCSSGIVCINAYGLYILFLRFWDFAGSKLVNRLLSGQCWGYFEIVIDVFVLLSTPFDDGLKWEIEWVWRLGNLGVVSILLTSFNGSPFG